MADFVMPSLGADMDAGTLVEWLVKPGDHVDRGDIVAVVETQKGAIEIEIFETGTLVGIAVDVGEEVPVGTLLATIDTGDGAVAPPKPAAPAPAEPIPAAAPVVTPPPAVAVPERGARLRVSPAARRKAEALGVDLAGLHGSGPGGAIALRDVEAAAAKRPGPSVKPGLDLAEMRKAVAAAMARAKREIPHYYLGTTIDLTAVTDWLTTTNAERPITGRLLPAVPLLKATALALRESPGLNGLYVDGEFRPSEPVHIGVAIALRGGGLIAPAIHDCDRLSLNDLMSALRDLVGRARTGRIRGSEMSDPTITVTSLGEDEVETLYPVIYPPQVAIVGFGAPADRPWLVDGEVRARRLVNATLAADHRVSDGRRGSRFLKLLDRLLQEPDKL